MGKRYCIKTKLDWKCDVETMFYLVYSPNTNNSCVLVIMVWILANFSFSSFGLDRTSAEHWAEHMPAEDRYNISIHVFQVIQCIHMDPKSSLVVPHQQITSMPFYENFDNSCSRQFCAIYFNQPFSHRSGCVSVTGAFHTVPHTYWLAQKVANKHNIRIVSTHIMYSPFG